MFALAALIASACVSAPVSYAPPPDRGGPDIPWIRSGPVTGYLFYYGATGPWKEQRERVIVPTNGRGPGYSAKILWRVRGGWGRVTLTGHRLDGAGTSVRTFKAAGGFFPSYLVLPATGCWRVTVASAGHNGSFAFVTVDV